jgi:hypothetical protein
MKKITLVLLLLATPTLAGPSQSDVNGCHADARRLCGVSMRRPPRAETISGERGFTVGSCLYAHRSQLSRRCDAAFRRHGH